MILGPAAAGVVFLGERADGMGEIEQICVAKLALHRDASRTASEPASPRCAASRVAAQAWTGGSGLPSVLRSREGLHAPSAHCAFSIAACRFACWQALCAAAPGRVDCCRNRAAADRGQTRRQDRQDHRHAAQARRGRRLRPLHLSDAARDGARLGADRPRSGGAGRHPGSWSSAASAKRSRRRSRTPSSSHRAARPTSRRTCATPFATSTIWMGDVVDSKPDGSFTVDLAGFLARDDFGVPQSDQARRRRGLQVRARS